MPRYIDAEKLIKKIRKCKFEITACGIMYHAGSVQSAINFAPAADVVEVVRCKDCIWWHTNACAFRNDCADGLPCADDFCSHGERKE